MSLIFVNIKQFFLKNVLYLGISLSNSIFCQQLCFGVHEFSSYKRIIFLFKKKNLLANILSFFLKPSGMLIKGLLSKRKISTSLLQIVLRLFNIGTLEKMYNLFQENSGVSYPNGCLVRKLELTV